MNAGIYYLIVRNKLTNEKIKIELTDRKEDRYCTTLSYIDSLTTKFNSKEELIKRLNDNKYIDFSNADIYIEYMHNGEKKFLEVIYKPYEGFSKLTKNYDSTIDYNNSFFKKGINNFFNLLNNAEFRSFVLDSDKINTKLKDHIKKCYQSNDEFFINKITEDFLSYKTFRDFTFLADEYHNPSYYKDLDKLSFRRRSNTVYQITEEPEIEDTSDDEFLTEDDWNFKYYPYKKK